MSDLTWKEFERVDMRIGTVIGVNDFPEARNPSYKLTIDFGEEIGIKETAAQITVLHNKEELLYKQVIGVINFPKKQIANFMSDCLVLGAVNGDEVTLLQPSLKAKNGLRIF